MTNATFQDAIQVLISKQEETKEIKKMMKDLENDVPMQLEELMLQIRDLKKQAKGMKDEYIKLLLEENAEYVEHRESIQHLREEIAEAKLSLFTEAAKLSREHGELDRTVIVEGLTHRVQTQSEVQVYLNGKVVK